MNNFQKRSITGIAFLIIMTGGILWNIWTFIGLFSFIALLGIWEFYQLFESKESNSSKISGLALGILLISACISKYFLNSNDILHFPGIYFIILIFPITLIIKLFSKNPTLQISSPALFSVLYTTLPFCYLILSFSSVPDYYFDNNSRIILGYFILIWSNDTFAYLIGKSLGKTKLFERISPKKTWEGTIGGILCTLGIAFILSIYFTRLVLMHWLILALLVSIFGTLGDLVESMFKRSLNVKDSGTILPGHGGILDRFDGVLLSAPFIVSYLILIMP